MKRATIAGGAFVILLVLALLAFTARHWAHEKGIHPAAGISPATLPSPATAAEAHPSCLYSRVTTVEGST
jgi:hypothetical protein